MKLEKILDKLGSLEKNSFIKIIDSIISKSPKNIKEIDNLNSLEKNSFIKIIDSIIANKPKNFKAIDKIIADTDKSGLKNLDNVVISRIFNLIETEFSQLIKAEFVNTSSQLDILTDIITRDGNCIMKQDWFARLYEIELKSINKKTINLQEKNL